MKQVTCWLNEREFKKFEDEAQKREMSNYAYAKDLILLGMEDEKTAELLKQVRAMAMRHEITAKKRLAW
jgi:hypothetical protein